MTDPLLTVPEVAALAGLGAAELPRAEWDYPPCVYFLVDQGEVVYVGLSSALVMRILQHRSDVRKRFDRVLFVPCPEHLLESVEGGLIKILNPRDNRAKFGERRNRLVSLLEENALRAAGLGHVLDGSGQP